MNQVNQLKKQLIVAIAMVIVSIIALSSSTYAWYVTNNKVESTTSTISATTNGFVLQIATGTEPQRGSDQALISSTVGHEISPASSDDMTTWYVPDNWAFNLSKVQTYQIPNILTEDGSYTLMGENYYAYVVGSYILYTVNQTGLADVYLDASTEGGAIQVYVEGEDEIATDKVAASLRVGIVIDNELKLVYAPVNETGTGNDVNGTDGWSTVADTNSTRNVSYPYIYGTNYVDAQGNNWAITKDTGNNQYIPPSGQYKKIAERVNYNGVSMKIYIWMEGTDEDCVNNIVYGDDSVYNVSINLAGIAVN